MLGWTQSASGGHSQCEKRSGAAEARWAHNPKVGGSKPPSAISLFFYAWYGFVAEWSKALDSSSSLHLKAWVRIPPEPFRFLGPVAQWIARKTSNLKVAGSSPARVAFWLRLASLYGGLAQSVECVVCNDEAPGSKPGFSISFFLHCPASWPSGYGDRFEIYWATPASVRIRQMSFAALA